jgi:hypothetical protein
MSLSEEAAENGAADAVSLNVEDVVHGGVDGVFKDSILPPSPQ